MKDLFITCPHGFESLLEKELRSLGIEKASARFCGVAVSKHFKNVFIANYLSRIATRVLWPLTTFPCAGKESLYQMSKKVNWGLYLNPKQTFAIDANVKHPRLRHSMHAALVVKDAICDQIREKKGTRPSIDTKKPDVQLSLFIQKGVATLYLDTSLYPLHKRGWRAASTEASIHESLAAGLLMHAGFDESSILCDPCCGSGTFLVEATLQSRKVPPGSMRKTWGFFSLPGFDVEDWNRFKAKEEAKSIPLKPGTIFGSDKSREVSEICKMHLKKVGGDPSLISYDELAYYKPKIQPNLILCNPPYGKRLELSEKLLFDLNVFINAYLAPGGSCHVLISQDMQLPESLQRRAKGEFAFKSGGLPVRLISLQ